MDGEMNKRLLIPFHSTHLSALMRLARPSPSRTPVFLVVGDDVGTKSKRSARKLPDKELSLILLDERKVI